MPRVAPPTPRHGLRRALRRVPAWLRRAFRPTRVEMLLVALAVAVGLLIWAEGAGLLRQTKERVEASFIGITADAGFRIQDVLVEGRKETSLANLRETLGIERGEPTLALDPARLRSAILGLPWVADAKVARQLPDLISVELIERQALARWQLNGLVQVIDGNARIIPGADPTRFAELPLLVGAGAAESGLALFGLLARYPTIAERVLAAIRVGERRWNLRFAHGLDVQLPEEDAEGALERLARLMANQQLLERDLVVIDLRQPDRLVVRPSPGALPTLEPEEGQDT